MVELNSLTDRNLLGPDAHTSNLLLSAGFQAGGSTIPKWKFPLQGLNLGVVGATGIEPVTPTMSR